MRLDYVDDPRHRAFPYRNLLRKSTGTNPHRLPCASSSKEAPLEHEGSLAGDLSMEISMQAPSDLNQTALEHAAKLIAPNCALAELILFVPEAMRDVGEFWRREYGIRFYVAKFDSRAAWSVTARGIVVNSEMPD
jgi:hypothetical protein